MEAVDQALKRSLELNWRVCCDQYSNLFYRGPPSFVLLTRSNPGKTRWCQNGRQFGLRPHCRWNASFRSAYAGGGSECPRRWFYRSHWTSLHTGSPDGIAIGVYIVSVVTIVVGLLSKPFNTNQLNSNQKNSYSLIRGAGP